MLRVAQKLVLFVIAISQPVTVSVHTYDVTIKDAQWLYGYASHYGVGTMEATADERDMSRVGCMVSSPYYGLGVWLVVDSLVTGDTMECRTTDVSKREHVATQKSDGIVLEFGAANIWKMCAFPKVGWDLPSACRVRIRVR